MQFHKSCRWGGFPSALNSRAPLMRFLQIYRYVYWRHCPECLEDYDLIIRVHWGLCQQFKPKKKRFWGLKTTFNIIGIMLRVLWPSFWGANLSQIWLPGNSTDATGPYRSDWSDGAFMFHLCKTRYAHNIYYITYLCNIAYVYFLL